MATNSCGSQVVHGHNTREEVLACEQEKNVTDIDSNLAAAITDAVRNGNREYGHFVEAVADRDWEAALARADSGNRERFVDIMMFRLNKLPLRRKTSDVVTYVCENRHTFKSEYVPDAFKPCPVCREQAWMG